MMPQQLPPPRSITMFGNTPGGLHARNGDSGDLSGGHSIDRSVRQVRRHLATVFDGAGAALPLDRAALDAAGLGTIEAIARDGARSWLAAVGHIDETVFRHSLMVAGVMSSLLVMLKVGQSQASMLVQGALLHDIGKVRIDPAILNKPGPLDARETAIMRTHTVLGEAMAQEAELDPSIRRMIRSHHEHLDGSGYPDGLRRAAIGNAVRALTICDVFSALVEPRCYKPALSPEAAFATMRLRAEHLDRDLLAMLCVALDRPATARDVAGAGTAPADTMSESV